MSIAKKLGLVAFVALFANVGLALAEDAVTTTATTTSATTTSTSSSSWVTDKSVAKNAGISYSKLNLKDSIMSTDIKDDQVKHDNIGDGAINSNNINKHAIETKHLSKDFKLSGEKVDPDFGDQDVITTGDVYATDAHLSGMLTVDSIWSEHVGSGLELYGMGSISIDSSYDDDNIALLPGTGMVGIGTIDPNATFDIQGVQNANRPTFQVTSSNDENGDTDATNDSIFAIYPRGRTYLNNYAQDSALTISQNSGYDIARFENDSYGQVAKINYDGSFETNGYVSASDGGWFNNNDDGVALSVNQYWNGNGNDIASFGNSSGEVLSIDYNGNIVPADTNSNGLSDDHNLGADAGGSRWSTIYADTLNYASTLTDDQSGDSDVIMGAGETNGNSVTIFADTQITDDEWSISYDGDATFNSVTSSYVVSSALWTNGVPDWLTFTYTPQGSPNPGDHGIALDPGDENYYVGIPQGSLALSNNGFATRDIALDGEDVYIQDHLEVDGIVRFDGTVDFNSTLNANNDVNLGDGDNTIAISGDDVSITDDDGGNTWSIDVDGDADLRDITADGTVDLSSASTIVASGTSLPGSCSTGQLFVDTDGASVNVTSGNTDDTSTAYLFVCTASNTWTPAIQN